MASLNKLDLIRINDEDADHKDDLNPLLKDITPDSSVRELLLAMMWEMYIDEKHAKPEIAGTLTLNGNLFDYEFILTSICVAHRSNVDTVH